MSARSSCARQSSSRQVASPRELSRRRRPASNIDRDRCTSASRRRRGGRSLEARDLPRRLGYRGGIFLASSWSWHSPLVHLLAGFAVAAGIATLMWLLRGRDRASRPSAQRRPVTGLNQDQRRWAQLLSITLLGVVLWLPIQGVIPHPTCRLDGALLLLAAGLAVVSVAALWSVVAAALMPGRGHVRRWLTSTGSIALRWSTLAAAIVIVDTLVEGR